METLQPRPHPDAERFRTYFLKKPNPSQPHPFRKSDLGGSGMTFLPLDIAFKWVIKWQTPYQSEAEEFCSAFYRLVFSDLTVPKTLMLRDVKINNLMVEFFKPLKEIPCCHRPPLTMQYLKGNNFSELCNNKKVTKFSLDTLFQLFFCFGRIASYDLLIANCDRFLPKNFREEIDLQHRINGGNIMVELDGDGQLKAINLIDNAPFFDAFLAYSERKKSSSQSGSLECLSGGLDFMLEEGGGSEPKTKTMGSGDSSKQETEVLGEQLREERKDDFFYFINGDDQAIRNYAIQIQVGIHNEADHHCTEVGGFLKTPNNAEHTLKALVAGLAAAQKELKADINIRAAFKETKEKVWLEPNTLVLIQFINDCFELVPQ